MTDLNNEVRALPTDEMTVDELVVVSGGTWVTEKIHIDYHNMNNFNDPTAVRTC